jgi:hypothetical protein
VPNFTAKQLLQDFQADIRYRERRHPQWTDNYLLYRDTLITNRLTQRQSVNVPLMKEFRLSSCGDGRGQIRTDAASWEDYGSSFFTDRATTSATALRRALDT